MRGPRGSWRDESFGQVGTDQGYVLSLILLSLHDYILDKHCKSRMNELTYPGPEQIIAFNHLALALVKVKKADRPILMNRTRLLHILEECIHHPGDTYDKAVVLLEGIIKKHPFASGNRRTAFLVMVDFLWDNNTPCRLQNNPEHARVLLGIREGFYTHQEIKEWIQHGKIRPFKR